MILVDTSVWIDHLRANDPVLAGILNNGGVLMHPFVLGELSLGSIRQRDVVLEALSGLPRANQANDAEVLLFITQKTLFGLGIGYIDAHLLAAVRLTPDASLWTRDKRLLAAAQRLNLAAHSVH